MPTDKSPVTYPGPPDASADVVVIGGGVIGVCSAIYLARAGQKVVLVEKGRIAGEQSSRNWGWIRQQGRDPDELPIMVQARQLWIDLAQETNVDIGLRQTGVTYLAADAAGMAEYEAWLPHARAAGLDSRLLGAHETSQMLPGASRHYAGALTTSSDMRAEPWVAVPALAGIAARAGVQIVEHCALRTLDMQAGRIVGVVTETGHIRAGAVVLAGGAWSSLFLRNHGVSIPQLSVRENVAATTSVASVHEGAAADSKVAFRRRADGGYTLAPPGVTELFVGPDAFRALPKYLTQLKSSPFGQNLLPAAPKGFPDGWGTRRRWSADEVSPFEVMRILDPPTNLRKISKLVAEFETLFPQLGPIQIKASWAGMIDVMPDIVPIVDNCADLPGLTVATGMSGHGFGIGPGIGRVIASLVTGNAVGHDLTRFRMNRFTDGSAIRLGPSV